MSKGINDKQDEKTARAKRADIEAMQERFDAIIKLARADLDLTRALALIDRIASGETLDEIVTDAGNMALGLK